MADVPVTEIVNLDAVIDALDTPTSSEVYSAIEPFNTEMAAASAISRAIAGGGGGGSSPISVTTVALTDAQIKALPVTPVEVVAAPAAGLGLMVVCAILELDVSAAGYTNIAAGSPVLYIGPTGESVTSAQVQLLGAGGVLDAYLTSFSKTIVRLGAETVLDVDPIGSNSFPTAKWWADGYDLDGIGLSIAVDNSGTGAFTGGDPANTLKVTTLYVTLTL